MSPYTYRRAGRKNEADAHLYRQLSEELAASLKGLIAEREKMLALIDKLSSDYHRRASSLGSDLPLGSPAP